MANEEHLKILKQGVKKWNEWREENPDIKPDLQEANLSTLDLRGANFKAANLLRADLPAVDVREANLQ